MYKQCNNIQYRFYNLFHLFIMSRFKLSKAFLSQRTISIKSIKYIDLAIISSRQV